MRTLILAAASTLALAACSDEPSVAEQFNALTAGVENKAREIDSEAENMVSAEERRLDAEAEALHQANENAMGNLVDSNLAAPANAAAATAQ
jgi:hypothetical protein